MKTKGLLMTLVALMMCFVTGEAYAYDFAVENADGVMIYYNYINEGRELEVAMALWEKVREAGYVDEDYQPLLSRSQSALLADAMAERLGIKEKWKVFETAWMRRNMYRDYYKALNLQQSLTFQDKIKRLVQGRCKPRPKQKSLSAKGEQTGRGQLSVVNAVIIY